MIINFYILADFIPPIIEVKGIINLAICQRQKLLVKSCCLVTNN